MTKEEQEAETKCTNCTHALIRKVKTTSSESTTTEYYCNASRGAMCHFNTETFVTSVIECNKFKSIIESK